MVWAVLESPTAICLAAPVAKQLGVPLITTVWDDPELLARQLNLDRFTREALFRQFSEAIGSSQRCAVIGESMKAAYHSKYGTDGVVIRHGVPTCLCRSPGNRVIADTIRIGFAGSLTARDAFKTLIAALNEASWKIAGREVVLRIIGARYTLAARQAQRIEYFGWRSVEETVALLSECDATYLPQPFADCDRTFTRLSFPTKLSTYLAAGRPIILHSPPDSSLGGFYRRYPFGVWCDTLDAAQLGQKIALLLTDDAVYQAGVSQVQAALRDEINEDVFRRRFAEFVGVDERLLLGPKQRAA
jgi:hypothetical protein